MRRRSRQETVERLQLHRLAELEDLRSMAARWARDHMDELCFADPDIPACITRDRARDNWRPLLAIADMAGQEWSRRARESASRLASLAAYRHLLGRCAPCETSVPFSNPPAKTGSAPMRSFFTSTGWTSGNGPSGGTGDRSAPSRWQVFFTRLESLRPSGSGEVPHAEAT